MAPGQESTDCSLLWRFPGTSQLTKYQEMSQLLDPHLEDLIMPLAAALNKEAVRQDGADIARVQGICRMVEVRKLSPREREGI